MFVYLLTCLPACLLACFLACLFVFMRVFLFESMLVLLKFWGMEFVLEFEVLVFN